MNQKTIRLRMQLSVLRTVAKEYSGRTLENVIDNIESRIKSIEV